MKKTSRRGFGKQLGLALGALPVASLASRTTYGYQPGDTPITVGGGGGEAGGGTRPEVHYTYVRFDHSHYTSTTPANEDEKHYKHDGDEPSYIVLFPGNGAPARHLTRYLDKGMVTLKFQDSDERVKIMQNSFGVKFKKSRYNNEVGNEHRRTGDGVLTSIVFKHETIDDFVAAADWKVCISKNPQGGDCGA
ncbi:MAG TPA: hypothetical protein VJT71_11765 [Pyrinomonadaceae bacterium]|nr:hypothetical protein [Pyrinomonadaceae bacterium]